MRCPNCQEEDIQVIDSRESDFTTIRRRRECSKCHYRFTTYEKVEPLKLTVIKRDGHREPYDREKILRGVRTATEKREIEGEAIEKLVAQVEKKLITIKAQEVTSTRIGNLVIKELLKLDLVSYLRFTSVYRGFSSLKSFEKELEKIRE